MILERTDEQNTTPCTDESLPAICTELTVQSPVSTWIADMHGTSIFQNGAARQLFGIDNDDEVIGKYNIFRDEVLTSTDLMPRIRRVFEEGGSTEFVVDYDAARLQHVTISHPTHRILRVFIFAIKDASGTIRHVAIQHEDQTERRRAEHALEQSEARYRQLVEDVSDWVWEMDLDGRYIYSSPASERILGYRPDELVGRLALNFIVPEDRAKRREAFEAAAAQGREITRHVYANKRKDGAIRYLEMNGRPMWDQSGRVIGYRGVDRDVTDTVEAHNALREEKERFKALTEHATDIVTVLDADGRICYESPSAESLLGYGPGELYGTPVFDIVHPDDVQIARRSLANVIAGTEEVVCAEIRIRHKDGSWHDIESSASRLARDHAAPEVVVNSRDVSRRRQAEEALRRSEAKIRAIINAMRDVVLILNSEGRYVMIAPTSPDLLYKPLETLLGNTLHDVFPKERADEFLDYIRHALQTHETINTQYCLDIGERHIWFAAAISPMTEDEVVWVARDITDLKQTEAKLAKTAEWLGTIVAASPVAIISVSLDDKITGWNPAAERIFGWKADEVIGAAIPIIPDDEMGAYREMRGKLLRGVVVCGEEIAGQTKGGSQICMSASHAATHDSAGNITGYLGLIEDITEKACAQRRLRESEEMYRTLFETMAQGVVYQAPDGRIIAANPAAERILGLNLEAMRGLTSEYPDWHAKREDGSDLPGDEHPAMIALRTGQAVRDLIMSVLNPTTKTRKWLNVSATPQFRPGEDKPYQVYATFQDITERIQAEQALRQSEAYLSDVIDAAPYGSHVYELEDDGRLVFVGANQSADRILGVDNSQFIGKTIEEAFPALVGTDVPEAYRNVICSGRKFEEERVEYDEQGISGAYEVHAFPISGKRRMAAFFQDITERKKSEEALRRSEQNFRALFDSMPASVFAYDRDGLILQANPAFERLYGFRREDVVGRSMFDSIGRLQDRERTFQIIEQVFSGKTIENVEWEDTRADGSIVYILSSSTPVFSPSGGVTMGLSMGVDITERKMAERSASELEEHKREFYRCTILAATEGKLEVAEKDEILRIAGNAIAAWDIETPGDLSSIRQDVARIARADGMSEDRVSDFVLAVGESTTNAYKHARGGKASLHRVNDDLMVVVSDTGKGMEALALPELAFTRGYTTAKSLGMGYKAILSVADKVYLATGPTGTTVAIQMALQPKQRPLPFVALPDTW